MSFNSPPPQRNFINLPILQKQIEAYKEWHTALPHMTRLTRYTLGEKIDLIFIELSELLLIAGYAGRSQKTPIIQKASIKLDVLKFFLQIAWELKSIETKTFANINSRLEEIGKMLGGWQKQLAKENPPTEGRI